MPPYVMPYFTALPNLERTKLQTRASCPCLFGIHGLEARDTVSLNIAILLDSRSLS